MFWNGFFIVKIDILSTSTVWLQMHTDCSMTAFVNYIGDDIEWFEGRSFSITIQISMGSDCVICICIQFKNIPCHKH